MMADTCNEIVVGVHIVRINEHSPCLSDYNWLHAVFGNAILIVIAEISWKD